MSGSTTPPPMPDPPDSPVAPKVAPPGRVGPRRVVAIVIATVLLAGIGGLVAAAVLGDDRSPSSDRLQQPLDLDSPAVATAVRDSEPTADSVAAAAAPPMPSPTIEGTTGDEPAGDGGIVPVGSIVSPDDEAELAPLASAPVELPELVPPPPEASIAAAWPIGELTPETVDALATWDVVERSDGYVAFSDGTVVIELFAADDPAPLDAGAVLTAFFDARADVARLTVSESAPQGAARPEFTSVAGAEYVAITAGQQGTRTMSGAALAAFTAPGSAVVATTSREGRASVAELAADADLLQAVLAHVDTA